MRLLSAGTTTIADPTAAAVRKRRLIRRDLPKGALVDVSLVASGTLTGTWEAGIVFSTTNGRSWNTGLITLTDGSQTPKFGVPNYALIGPSLTVSAGSPSITLDIVGGES
jgi:hypothetical protein